MCAETGCKWEVFEQGVCRHHYRVDRKAGSIPYVRIAITRCEAPGCEEVSTSLRLCKRHYGQFARHGYREGFKFDTVRGGGASASGLPDPSVCKTEGCESPRWNKRLGLCTLHYGRYIHSVERRAADRKNECSVKDCGRAKLVTSKICKRCNQFRFRYNLTVEQVFFYMANRSCGNPGCDTVGPYHMDHAHECCPPGKFPQTSKVSCGKCVRGWLCAPCNKALGMTQEDPARLQGLLDYLKKYAML